MLESQTSRFRASWLDEQVKRELSSAYAPQWSFFFAPCTTCGRDNGHQYAKGCDLEDLLQIALLNQRARA